MRNTKQFLRWPTGALAAWGLVVLAMGARAQAPAPSAGPATASPTPAAAAASGQPDATSAAYGDWVLQCQRDAAQAGGPLCELRQTMLGEGQRPIAQLAIARLSAQAPLKLAVVLPTHVSFAEAPRLAAGEAGGAGTAGAAPEAAISLTWRRCLPMGCFADGDLSEPVTRQWRSQAPVPAQAPAPAGRLVFQDGGGRAVVLPVSFRGLGEALDAMNRK
jgi:invasion protein IalB